MSFVDQLKERAFAALLQLRTRPAAIGRYASSTPFAPAAVPVIGPDGTVPIQAIPPVPSGHVRLAAVQMELRLHDSPNSYVDQVGRLAAAAAATGASLIAFPEDSATGLLGLLPGIEKVAGAASMASAVSEMVGDDVSVADIFRFIAPATQRTYEAAFAALARRYGVHLVTGSAILPGADGSMKNIAYFYGPDGSLLGRQEKCHFIPMEVEWGLAAGAEFGVHELPWGRVALPICMDATYFETFRIVTLLGADVVVIPTANPEDYNLYMALRGIWPRVQESQAYGLHSCLVGRVFGLHLTGRSGVFAPMDLTPKRSGVLAQTPDPESECIVYADVDIAALRRYRAEHPLHFNVELYEKYLPGLYTAPPPQP